MTNYNFSRPICENCFFFGVQNGGHCFAMGKGAHDSPLRTVKPEDTCGQWEQTSISRINSRKKKR